MTEPLSAIEEAERAGFDMSLLDANLSYTYEKRVLLHDAALELALELERIGRQLHGATQGAEGASREAGEALIVSAAEAALARARDAAIKITSRIVSRNESAMIV
jgi:hypothetical protein